MVEAVFSAGDGSLVDFNTRQIPNYSKVSPILIEKVVDGSIQLYAVAEHHPAFDAESGAFLLEPAANNLVTHNMDLSQSVWLKGSNLNIRTDYSGRGNNAPDGTNTSDRVLWDGGIGATGASQSLKRDFTLEAEATYTLWGIFRLQGGLFGGKDFMQVLGGVDAEYKVSLADLNDYKGRYTVLELTFTTAGKKPRYPNTHAINDLLITNVSGNVVDVEVPANLDISQDAWVGGRLYIQNQYFEIIANTVNTATAMSITVDNATLSALGISNGDTALLEEAAPQEVTIELYSESTASIDWGGLFLTQTDFRSSPIYQLDEVDTRAQTLLSYRRSPISGLTTFAVFGQINEWRGDGNLIDSGNFSLSIEDGYLVAKADAVEVQSTQRLSRDFKFMVQVAEATSSIVLYVDSILEGRATVVNFTVTPFSQLEFTSQGLREWQRILVYDQPLLEGKVELSGEAKADVQELFANPVPISPDTIAAHVPLITLPPVTVPARQEPIAESYIVAVNNNNRTVQVEDSAGFIVETDVVVMREEHVIMRTSITSKSGTTLGLRTNANVQQGDRLIYGSIDTPGRASVRFPYDPIDPQEILTLDANAKRVSVESSLSFEKARAFVFTDQYVDTAEVMVEDRDDVNGYLFLDTVANVDQGSTIAQPGNELWINPANYYPSLLEAIDGVTIAEWYSNAVLIENLNDHPVTVTPAIRASL